MDDFGKSLLLLGVTKRRKCRMRTALPDPSGAGRSPGRAFRVIFAAHYHPECPVASPLKARPVAEPVRPTVSHPKSRKTGNDAS